MYFQLKIFRGLLLSKIISRLVCSLLFLNFGQLKALEEKYDGFVFNGHEENLALTTGIHYLRLENDSFPVQWPSVDLFMSYSLQNSTLRPGYYLIQIDLQNLGNEDTLLLDFGYHRIKSLDMEVVHENGTLQRYHMGMFDPISQRRYNHHKLLFDIPIQKGEKVQCRCRIYSHEFFSLPMQIGTEKDVLLGLTKEDVTYSLFTGIFLSMILYNLFIYLTTKDKMYLKYLVYTAFLVYSQLSLFGFLQHFVFGEFPQVDYWCYMVSGSLVGTTGCMFIAGYLEIKKYSIWIYRCIMTVGLLFPFYLILDLLGFHVAKEFAYDILGLSCFTLFYIAVYITIKKGNLKTKFLLVGWSLFMLGYITFILKNEGVLPLNNFTHYGMITGSALEMLLLSFALADRFNTIRKDNEKKQEEIIRQLETNEKFLRISKQLELDKERLKKEILLSEYESLKKQVSPHFLFNSLNVLADLVQEEPELAVSFVSELAKVYRYILECEQERLVELSTEVEFIKSYVFLLKIRFEENLQVVIAIPDAEYRLIAPLTLQLLVENAVKHNIISSAKPLRIGIFLEDGFVVVSNNFQARRDHNKSIGLGLNNIKSRYQFFSTQEVQVLNIGEQFVVKVPLIDHEQV
jgi:sensor histidine kinase YesM